LVWLAWRRRGPAALLALSLLPSLNLIPIARWWSPHYLYVPLAFAAMLLAEGAERLGRRAVPVACGVCAILAGASFAAGRHLGSDAALWSREVRAEPACREGQFYLGEVARQERRWDEAAARYEAALAATPAMLAYAPVAAALQNLGAVRLEQGRFGEAAAVYRQALAEAQGERRQRELTHDLATALLQAGDPEQAARLLEPEVARPDAFPQSILVRARALHQLGREDEARALVRRLRQERARSPNLPESE